MGSPSNLYPKQIDLTNCDKEPIHKLNLIQNHGFIISTDYSGIIQQYSSNIVEFLTIGLSGLLGSHIVDFFGVEYQEALKQCIHKKQYAPFTCIIDTIEFLVIPHSNEHHVIFEFEKNVQELDPLQRQNRLSEIITNLSNAANEYDMCDLASKLVKDFLGYDRVMLYKFDENWNGEVIAEAKEEHLESWLGLHYPATDIPQQARKLFLNMGVRVISEITEFSASMIPEISPVSNDILDLSKSELRAPSAIHIEYLKNMKVGGTLTAAIVHNNMLWGLIACHHYRPKMVSYQQRLSCKFLAQVFSTQLGLRSFNSSLQKINNAAVTRNKLVKQMSIKWDIVEGLARYDTNVIDLTEASGAAIFIDGNITLLGETPSENEILALNDWIEGQAGEHELFYTHTLSKLYPESDSYRNVASGVLYIAITKGNTNKLFWFKPELLKTVSWGGNPNKAIEINSDARLSPRKSFEKWSEEVKGQSLPWQDYEISAAKALKENISEIIIRKYEEVMYLNRKLEKAYKDLESFSYSVSHDLRAPLRGIDGFAQIIKEDYYDALDDYGRSALDTIINSTEKMNELIDDILNFSGLQQKQIRVGQVNLSYLINEVIELNQVAKQFPNTKIIIQDDLPDVSGDRSMILQLLSNLISNALKYSATRPKPVIEIGYHNTETPVVFYVKDNGIGLDMKYKDSIFEVFNRLVDDSYPGSGIGLAIVKRVVERHNGNVWVESREGEGTTFNFCFNISEGAYE